MPRDKPKIGNEPLIVLNSYRCSFASLLREKIQDYRIRTKSMRAINSRPQTQMLSPRPALRGGKGESRHRRAPGKHAKIFLPGQPVTETGIYEVIHDRGHRQSHEAVMHRESMFPACDQCDMRVRFKLVRTAPYIFEDEDFIEEK